MQDCIFCKIVKGDMPSHKIYEDDLFYGLLDIFPRTKGHTLLIPKKHHRWVYDVPEFGRYWEAAKKISDSMMSALEPSFITYVTHGLEVPHAHIHIMPRYTDTSYVPDFIKTTKEELGEIARLLNEAKKD